MQNSNDVRTDINATNLLSSDGKDFSQYSPIYRFANDNISGYLPSFDLENKKVLTVAASGDHPLNMALQGATDIACFDINKLAYYWLELKKAGVLTLDFESFKQAFLGGTFAQSQTYKQIRPALESDTKNFWDEVSQTRPDGQGLFRKSFLGINKAYYQNINPYLVDGDNYSKLKRKLGKLNFNFVDCNIFDIPQAFNKEKFDAMFTSNICDYVDPDKYKILIE